MNHRTPRGRRLPRIAMSVLVAGAAVALLAAVLSQSWSATSADRRFVDQERQGVRYLQPLGRLIETLSVAESAAVGGGQIDQPTLQSQTAEMDAVDRQLGVALGTGPRWADLRLRIGALIQTPGSGRTAYQSFTDAIALATALQQQVTDVSNLILDPDLDSYYLMDAALLRLPAAEVAAGQAADLLVLAGGQPKGEDADAVAVARHQVALLSSQVAAGVSKTVKATADPDLAAALTAPQDAYQAAVDGFAPPDIVRQLSAPFAPDEVIRAAEQVRSTALALSVAALDRLDRLLADRRSGLLRHEQLIIAGVVGVPVAVIALLWLLLPTRGVALPIGEPEAELEETVPEPVAPEPVDILDARELLHREELVHVGRGVRARRKDQDDDDAF